MKLIYLTFSLVFLQCQTKYSIYQRNHLDINEQFDINTKTGVFLYSATFSNEEYKTKGKLELVDSTLYLVFPENAELSLLSPFKKGYFELLNTYESDQIEIEIINYDVRTKGKLSQSRHDKPVIEILSIEDSSLIRKEPYPFVRIQDTEGKVLLRSKVNSYFDQYVEIPGRGQYQLKVFLQPLQTLESYETTTAECYRVVNGPILLLRATEVENKQIKNLTPVGESYIPYAFKEPPYSLVEVEKRKLRLFK